MAANQYEMATYPDRSSLNPQYAHSSSLLLGDSDEPSVQHPKYQNSLNADQSERPTKPIEPSKSGPRSGRGSRKANSFAAVCRAWAFELCACLLAFVVLMAIIVTLKVHDGRPLPNWPLSISVNALISVFAIIFKGTMTVAVANGIIVLESDRVNELRLTVHSTSYKSTEMVII